MSSKSSWAKVKSDMHDDEKIENIACEYGARTLAYWIVLICESKKVHRTRGGWSGPWTITQFAAKCYDEKSTKKSVRALVERFVQEGLLEVTGELTGRWRARPSMFIALQEQGDSAVRKENSRGFLQGKSSNGHVSVTKENAKNNQKKGPRIENENEKLVSKDTCQNDDFDPSDTDEKIVSFKANVTDVEQPSKIKNDDVLDVFQYWVEQDTRTGGTTLAKKLTNDRRQKIRARLKEGYEVEQLKQAIDYYLSQPFYLGENDRNKRYTDLTTIFRSGSKVEQGLQAAPVKSVKRTLSLEELEADVLAEFEAQRNGGVR